MKLSPDFRFFCFGAVVSAEGEGRWASALPYGVRTRVSDDEQTSRRYSLFIEIMEQINPNFNVFYGGSYGCHCAFLGSDRPVTNPGVGPAVDVLDRTCKNFKSCLACAREKYGSTCISELQEYGFTSEASGFVQCTDPSDSCKRAICECTTQFAVEHAAVEDVTDGFLHYMTNPRFQHREICPNLCNKDNLNLSNTNEHLDEGSADGSYPSLEFLVNDRKCYEKEDGSQIVWNNEESRWEITENGEVKFVNLSDKACPPTSDWNIIDEDGAVGQSVDILVGGSNVGPVEAYQRECCANPNGPFSIFNSVSQECCSDGTVSAIGAC